MPGAWVLKSFLFHLACQNLRTFFQPQNWISIQTLIKAGMLAVEEVEARLRTFRKSRVFQALVKFLLDRGILQHVLGDGFRHIGLHVLLPFEDLVQIAPG